MKTLMFLLFSFIFKVGKKNINDECVIFKKINWGITYIFWEVGEMKNSLLLGNGDDIGLYNGILHDKTIKAGDEVMLFVDADGNKGVCKVFHIWDVWLEVLKVKLAPRLRLSFRK